MQLEQRMEQSERLLEFNEQNKRRLEAAQEQVRRAVNRTNAAMAQAQQSQNRLQQAVAARNAAAQRTDSEGNKPDLSSYDAAVDRAREELRVANQELQESRRKLLEAKELQEGAEYVLGESTRELHGVAAELQQVSEKYGVEISNTRQLMSLPHAELASSLLQRLGAGQSRVDALRQKIAASLGVSMAASSSGYAGGSGDGSGYGVRAKILTRSGTNTLRRGGGGGGYGDEGNSYPDIGGPSAATNNAVAGNASGGYRSPYVKTTYSGPVTYRDPQTKQQVTKISNRTVYENRNLDPNLVVPAGTRRGNGSVLKESTTNLELMRAGKAPFILHTYPDGSTALVQVELHHLTGRETVHGSQYFSGKDTDGTMVEISSATHDLYSKQLHLGTPSFRRGKRKQKTADGAKYDSFRSIYWKNRAAKFEAQ